MISTRPILDVIDQAKNYVTDVKNGTYLDVAIGDVMMSEEIMDHVDVQSVIVVTDDVDEKGESIPRDRLFIQIDLSSVDITSLIHTVHYFSNEYVAIMNKLAYVTKGGSLLILADFDVHDYRQADELEFNSFRESAKAEESYESLYRRARASYTRIDEIIVSFRSFGFYLLFDAMNVDIDGQYVAIFRKSAAPTRTYIPTFIHPEYSIEAKNIHELVDFDGTDEELYIIYATED